MKDLSKKGYCRECQFWQQFDGNPIAGHCPLLGALFWEVNNGIEISIVASRWKWNLMPPTSDAVAVRTTQYFGCIHYEPEEEDSE